MCTNDATESVQALDRYSLVLLSCALVMALTAAGCSKKSAEAEPVVTVQAAGVTRATIERVVSAEAVVYPLQQAVITPKISSPVRTFYINRGSRVHKGQLLAVLENKDLEAAAADSRAGYEQAQATYASTIRASLPEEIEKAELDAKAKREALDAEQKAYDSRKRLYEQGALARKDFDQSSVALIQARNDYQLAERHLRSLQSGGRELELKSAKAQLNSAQAKYEGAEAQLAYAEIRSPIDGVVTDRPLYPGEMAAAGSPLLTIMDASIVQARAHVALQDAQLLKRGDSATISAPGRADDERGDVPGRVTMVSSALDPSSTTVEIWIQARNPEGRLKAGSTVRVSAVAQKVTNALVIPASAVLTGEDRGTSVMAVGGDGKAHQRPVKTGIHQGDQVQIIDGLKEGDRVVTTGAYGLPDNTAVQVQSPGESPETGAGKNEKESETGKAKD